MERLTKTDHGIVLCKNRTNKCTTDGCGWCKHNMAVFNRLAAYEDTGLTPEEIAEMAKERQHMIDQELLETQLIKMVDRAAHAIGLPYKKAYMRHGKYWYKPYRNYYCTSLRADPVWEEMVRQGYAEAVKDNSITNYHLTRKGLDWLGGHTGIKIHDPEE